VGERKEKRKKATVYIDKVRYFMGCYETRDEANAVRNQLRMLPHFFHLKKSLSDILDKQGKLNCFRNFRKQFIDKEVRLKTSSFRGVYLVPRLRLWKCEVTIAGLQYTIGHYEKEEVAGDMRLKLLGSQHFNALEKALAETSDRQKKRFVFSSFVQQFVDQRKRVKTSPFKGVSWNSSLEKWEAYKYINRKKYHIFYTNEEEDATKAVKNIELAMVKGKWYNLSEDEIKKEIKKAGIA